MINRDHLREEIDSVLDSLEKLAPGTQDYDLACVSLERLCRIENECISTEGEVFAKSNELAEEKRQFKLRMYFDGGKEAFDKLFKSFWLAKGYQIEETGSMTGSIFRTLMSGVTKSK